MSRAGAQRASAAPHAAPRPTAAAQPSAARSPSISLSSPSRRPKTPATKSGPISVTATRKLPFQEKPELGPKHRRSLENGLTRAVVPAPRPHPNHAELNGLDTTSQRVLNELLVRLTALLLRSQATKTQHDSSAVRDHAYQRAHEVVDEELSRIITKLIGMQGPSPMHRIVGLSQLSTSITRDVEKAIFTDDRAYLANFANEQRVRREEATAAHAAFAHELATKEQALATVSADKAELEKAAAALSRKCEALEKELEKSTRNQQQVHQNAVELRMQGLDFKARVDNRCARILASIQSRMGFIPAGIQKQVLYLKVLKAPGDPQYDEVRMHAHQRASKRRFDPGDEKRHLGVGVGLGPRMGRGGGAVPGLGSSSSGNGGASGWASRVVNDELPSHLPRPHSAPGGGRAGTGSGLGLGGVRGSFASQNSSDAEAVPRLSRQAKTQEDWVRWATNRTSADFDLLDHVSADARAPTSYGAGGDDDDEDEGEGEGMGEEEDDEDDEGGEVRFTAEYGRTEGRFRGGGEEYDDSSDGAGNDDDDEDSEIGGGLRGVAGDYLWTQRLDGSLLGER